MWIFLKISVHLKGEDDTWKLSYTMEIDFLRSVIVIKNLFFKEKG